MSASAVWRPGAAALLAAFALAILVAKGGALLSGYQAAYADDALRAANRTDNEAVRDQSLKQALGFTQDGLRIAPEDPRLWGLRAETLLRQALATAGQREALLKSSAEAARHAVSAAPNDSAGQARLSLVLALQAEREAAAAALLRSYDLDITSEAFGHRRLEAAARAWRELGAAGQRNVVNEACMLASRTDEDRARISRLRFGAADAGMALTLDEVLADGACRGAAS